MSFATDWIRRARARNRARMVRYIEGEVAARLATMKKLTPAEMMAAAPVRVEPHIVITCNIERK